MFFTLQVTALAQSASREDLQKQLEAKRAELQKLEDQFLAPSDEDRTAFAELLKQPDTGLIRLLPREVYDQFPNKPAKLTIHGGYLSVGFAGADYGLMTTIGQVPLEEVSLEHPLAAFLASYKPPNEEADARLEHRSFRPAGKIIDGVTYQERLPVQLNTTYLLRSINYEESDVLVAFRVVRRDSDGSVVLAWKLLKKYPKPVLTRSQVAS
ncbi:MAG: hypothetical protein DMF75_21575 [Acidobacteria bacterium]|nr:MAG: hypothetical protein DMF75_21575 [Acidobacteriota bacterium]